MRYGLSITNAEFFLYQAEAEKDDGMINARKILFQADRKRRQANPNRAIELYERVLGTSGKPGPWGDLLLKHARYRQVNDNLAGETFEIQYNYLTALREVSTSKLQASFVVFDLIAQRYTPQPVSSHQPCMGCAIDERQIPGHHSVR